jgi:DNA polymerase-1
VPVGAVYGYTTMLWKLADDLQQGRRPDPYGGDSGCQRQEFRNDIYPDYKANRPPAPEDLKPQFPLVRDATRAFSLALH